MMWFLLLSKKEKVMTPYEDHERKMDELLKDLQSGIITHEEFANNEIVKNHKAIRKEKGKTVERNAMSN